MSYFKFSLLTVCVFILPAAAVAGCLSAPDCTTLGYTIPVADCDTSKPVIKCPTDLALASCQVKKQEPEVPIEPDLTVPCAVGTILFSDKTCGDRAIVGKTPIAVVFDVTNRLAVALEMKRTVWSNTIVSISGLSYYNSANTALADTNGKQNTNKILYTCGGNCEAATFCRNYKTEGTRAGDWYLPSMGELNKLYNNIKTISATFDKLNINLIESYYRWSSTLQAKGLIWCKLPGINHQWGYKESAIYTQPILQY